MAFFPLNPFTAKGKPYGYSLAGGIGVGGANYYNNQASGITMATSIYNTQTVIYNTQTTVVNDAVCDRLRQLVGWYEDHKRKDSDIAAKAVLETLIDMAHRELQTWRPQKKEVPMDFSLDEIDSARDMIKELTDASA